MFFHRYLQEENLDEDLPPYIYLVLYLSSFISLISFFGAIFVVATYIRFRRLRSFAFKLVTFISLSDFLFYCGKLLSLVDVAPENRQSLCSVQGLLITFGELASVLWSAVVAFTLYGTVLKKMHRLEEMYYDKFKLFAIGIPALFTFIPWSFGFIGKAGDKCWIIFDARHRWTSFGLRMVMFYIPLWIVIAFNAYVYFKLIKYLNTINAKINRKRIALYPLILVVCWFFPTIHIWQSSFGGDSEFLNALHNLTESMQGILNAIIYGMNTDVKREWKRVLHNKFGWFAPPQTNISIGPETELLESSDEGGSHFPRDRFSSYNEAFELERELDFRDYKMSNADYKLSNNDGFIQMKDMKPEK